LGENLYHYDNFYYLFNDYKSGNGNAIKFLILHDANMTIKDKDNRIAIGLSVGKWKSPFSQIFNLIWSGYK